MLVTKADIDAKLESGLLQAYVALSVAWRAHGEDANGSVCGSKCDSCSEAAVAEKAIIIGRLLVLSGFECFGRGYGYVEGDRCA